MISQIRLSYQGHTNTRDNSDNAKERFSHFGFHLNPLTNFLENMTLCYEFRGFEKKAILRKRNLHVGLHALKNYKTTKSNSSMISFLWRLFSTVDSSLLRRPSYEKYIALMNNYKKEAGEPEPAVSLSEVNRETRKNKEGKENEGKREG